MFFTVEECQQIATVVCARSRDDVVPIPNAVRILTTLGGHWILTSDGAALEVDGDFADAKQIDGNLERVFRVHAARTFPSLSFLVPPRPIHVSDCVECEGRGSVHVLSALDLNEPELNELLEQLEYNEEPLCDACGGYGWR